MRVYRVIASFEIDAEDEEDASRQFQDWKGDHTMVIESIREIEECNTTPIVTSLP
jgi:hypothetical protein